MDNFPSSWGSIKTHFKCPHVTFTLGRHAVQNRVFFTCVFDYGTGGVVLLMGPRSQMKPAPLECYLFSPGWANLHWEGGCAWGTGLNMCLHIWLALPGFLCMAGLRFFMCAQSSRNTGKEVSFGSRQYFPTLLPRWLIVSVLVVDQFDLKCFISKLVSVQPCSNIDLLSILSFSLNFTGIWSFPAGVSVL